MNKLKINNLTKTYLNRVRALKGIITSFQVFSSGSIPFNNNDVVKQPNEIRIQLSYLPMNIHQM